MRAFAWIPRGRRSPETFASDGETGFFVTHRSAQVVKLLRLYFLTVLVLAAGLMWDLPIALTVGAATVAGLVDWCITRRSPELLLYQGDLELRKQNPSQAGYMNVVAAQIGAAFLSISIPMVSREFIASELSQQFASVVSLLIGGAVASYFGFRAIRTRTDTPIELLGRLDTMVDVLMVIDLVPFPIRRLLVAVTRVVLGALIAAPFLLMLNDIHAVPSGFSAWVIAFALAVLFQLGGALIFAGLFSLFWWKETESSK